MNPVLLVASLSLATHGAPGVTPPHAHAYARAYHEVASEFGTRAPGRNLLRWGTIKHRRATDAEIVVSLGVLNRMLTPRATSTQSAPASYQPASVTNIPSASTGGPLPSCTWQPESGGNWGAVNPTSGAYGMYQILPSTGAAYGCNLTTHAGQTACAETIWRNQGPSAWVNC